jgi:DNA-directed DNA polymerase III PolC
MRPEEIVERACRMELGALALTDVNNMYGAVGFQRLAAARGLKGVVGAELRTESDRATLLARNREGYTNLCRALTRLHLDGFENRASAQGDRDGGGGGREMGLVELLDGGASGLYCIVEDPALARRLADVIPREGLRLELATPGRPVSCWERNVAAAKEIGVGVVATGEAWFGAAEDWVLHRALRAVAGKTLVQRAGGAEGVAHPNAYMATPEQMARRLGRYAWALRESSAIAESCELSLETDGHIFPFCDLAPGQTPRERLGAMCREGMRARYGSSPPPRAAARLNRELEIIERLGFSPYFIVVGEIVAWARGRGISIVGRGSGASSLAAYLLGITGVDPLRYGLCFERFLNSNRPDYPDLDVDLCWRRRDEVIDHVYRTYGHDRVAMISTHVTFQKRSALREMAKAWGLSPDDVLKTLKEWGRARERGEGGEGDAEEMRDGWVASGRSAHGRHADGGSWPSSNEPALSKEPLRTVLSMARSILGFPRHLGIHCGGLVISPGPLRDIVPLERAPKGVVVTQYEMNAIEMIGLVKMDLLGNRGLTVAQDCLEMAAARAGCAEAGSAPGDVRAWRGRKRGGVPANLEDIPDGDRGAAAVLAAGDTLGCFQIESPAMRQLLSMLGPRNSDEVIAAVALVRPGPSASGMKDAFVRRKRGLEKTNYTHPCLAPVLKDTYGVMLYEEDVLKVGALAAGLSLEDGDDLRRALAGGARGRELDAVRGGFLRRVTGRGMTPGVAAALWDDLARFSSYAFCKAHASGYGLLAYRTAYLKAHYPVEFAVAVLNNHGGMYPTRVHLEDARRRGAAVLPPCVNRSAGDFTVEGDAIRVGLGRVKGLREEAVAQIISERHRSPFESLGDLLERVSLTAPEAEALVLSGALDFTGATRPSLLLEALAWARGRGKGRRDARQSSIARLGTPPAIGELRDFGGELRVEMEGRHLGLTPSRHPVSGRARVKERVACSELREHLGREVGIVGAVSARRRIRTEDGEPMLFLTMEDETGLVEAVVFPDAYRRMTVDLDRNEPLHVTGKVEDHYGALTLVADRVRPARYKVDPGADDSSPRRPDSASDGPCLPWGGG